MPFLVESMHVELDARSIAAIGRSLSVVPGACGPHAPLMGAAELAWESVIANPIESLDHRVLASSLH